jgi:hypothetical protein
MKEPQRYILKQFSIGVIWILTSVSPLSLHAQDTEDSVQLYSDSVISTEAGMDSDEVTKRYRDEVVLRSVPDTTVERMKRDKAFAYANDPAYWVKQKRVYRKGFWDYTFDFFTSPAVRFTFYMLLFAVVIFVIYRIIVVNDLFVFRKSPKANKLFDDSVTREAGRDMVDAKIQEAIDLKDFHMAVRYLFLKTLYLLNDKNWIQFHPEATNNDYLNQMYAHRQNKEFRFLTRVYEYIWYGKFQITEQQFSSVHSSFKQFHNSL